MPTRMNPAAMGYFNSPAFAQAASNIASIFAPPSIQEYAAAESLAGKTAENQRLAELWQAAGGDFDRMGAAAGQWNPTQGFGARDMADATARRGQDITAATSMGNNRLDNLTDIINNRTGALNEGQVLPGMDPATSDLIGSIFGTDIPAGAFPAAEGRAKPLTPDQVMGGETQRLIRAGDITDDDIYDSVMGSVPVEQVVGPDNNPVFARRSDAVGMQPFVNRGAEAKPDAITFERNGVRMGGFVRDGQFVDSTGRPLAPEEAGTAVKLGQPQGSNADVGVTNSNQTDYNRVQQTVTASNLLIDDLSTLINSQAGAAGLVGTMQSLGQDFGQVLRELSAAAGPDASISAQDIAALEGRLGVSGDNYNPTYRQIRSGLLQLAYLNAQRDNPRGEVSRFALERQIEALGQGLLANDQSILSALEMSRRANDRALAGAEALVGRRAPAAGGTPPPADPLTEAREAIRLGADPAAVRQRLIENGIDPEGL